MNSMIAQPAGALGAILLSALADGTSLATAMVVGGVICALAAPFYIPAGEPNGRGPPAARCPALG